MYYILNEKKEPVKVDMIEWATSMEDVNNKIVKQDMIGDDIRVSTVFLGLDHRFLQEGDPILFETMIFGSAADGYQERYCTYKEAEEGHLRAIEYVKTLKQ